MQHCSVEAMLVAGPEDMRSDAEADLGDPELARDTSVHAFQRLDA